LVITTSSIASVGLMISIISMDELPLLVLY
jgi:hypothetical protein